MIVASPVVADGRVYVTSMDATYAIGKRVPQRAGGPAVRMRGAVHRRRAPVTHVQVFPYESLLAPGGSRASGCALFDAKGKLVREEPASRGTWAVDQLAGHRRGRRHLRRAGRGIVRGIRQGHGRRRDGQARVRVIAPLPWTFRLREAGEPKRRRVVGRRARQGVSAHDRGCRAAC